jgi:hypothetical protein
MTQFVDNGRPKAEEYGAARDSIAEMNSDRCKEEKGCDASEQMYSRFYFCHIQYNGSADFLRALLDKYVPNAHLPDILLTDTGGDIWKKALAMPSGSSHGFPPPPTACTTSEQVGWPQDAARSATVATETAARRAADRDVAASVAIDLRNAANAKRKVDLTVFGVIGMGKPLSLAACPISGMAGKSTQMIDHDSLHAPCVQAGSDTSSTVLHFPSGGLPEWVGDGNVAANALFGDVVSPVAAKVAGGVVVSLSMDARDMHGFSEDLRQKYGPPKVTDVEFRNNYGNKWVAHNLEWLLPGLHVEFVLNQQQGNLARLGVLTIELESQYKSKANNNAKDRAKRLKL